MQASDIMTTDVITVTPETSVYHAAALLTEHRISGMPVVDDEGQVVGIVSEGDLLHRIETGTLRRQRTWLAEFLHSTRELAGEYLKEHALKVGDVMTDNVISVRPTSSLGEIADLLDRHHIKRVPVLQEGRVVGIVSRSNLIHMLAGEAPSDAKTQAADETIHRHAVQALGGHRWAMAAENLVVVDGIVHVWGTVRSEEERDAIRVTIERVPGVKGVENHLGYPVVIPAM
ncbi:CBS domain-containing protein [Paraburkholderia phosphatilytica]|uniref:CBS domain-containing protein n=1 Tax=Paraburkholderia phosphatilytica TaxID=2282883 RepID=UPI000E4BE6DF|nr:CBS domain-containing protein [Paraburkholderia phosphatilytica]